MNKKTNKQLRRAFAPVYMSMRTGENFGSLVHEMTLAPAHELLQMGEEAEQKLKREHLRKFLLLGVIKLMAKGEFYQSLRKWELIKSEPVKYVEYVSTYGNHLTRMVAAFDDLDLIALQEYFLTHEATEDTSRFIHFLTWARDNQYLRMPSEQELQQIDKENV